METDSDMQYTGMGTSTSLQKKHGSCRPREQEMAGIVQKKKSGGKFRYQCEKSKISPPKYPPSPPVSVTGL